MSRSHRSFTTQPAVRITTLPSANSTIRRADSRGADPDSRMPQSPGRNSSQMPIGRSTRASSSQGSQDRGSRATQPVATMSVCVCMAATLRAMLFGSIRLFVDAPLAAGTTIAATSAQAHYLGTVMRRGSGDAVRLFNGRDGEFGARIVAIRRDKATLVVEHNLRLQVSEPDLWLAFALLKRDATDLVVQKAAELGVAALIPVITERTNAHRVNETRLAAIAVEAAEQCERLTVPTLHQPRTLTVLLAGWQPGRQLFVAVERAAAPSIVPAPGSAALLVGPEGGFTPAELDAMQTRPFVTLVSLGPRILRAETACIVGLALLQATGRG